MDPQHLLAGVPLQQLEADLQLFTDASIQGWEAHMLDLQASGLWNPSESALHINLLEAESRTSRPRILSAVLPGQNSVGDVRQLHCGCLHQEPEGNQILGSVPRGP